MQVDYCHFDVVFGCFVFDPVSFAFQTVLFSLCRLFFIIGWKKDAVCVSFLLVFWITADREWVGNMADEGEENRILSFHLQYGTVSYHSIGNYIQHSLPVDGG